MDEKQKKKLAWQLPFLALLIIGTVIIVRQQHSAPYQRCSGTIFGTTYTITYQHGDDLKKDIVSRLLQVDSALSMFNPESVISHINHNTSDEANTMFIEVFQLAQQIAKDTDGAFDITVAPLVNAWGFGFKHDEHPGQAAIDSLMHFVGYQKATLQGRHIRKQDPRVMLDCSAIAKGYGADQVAQLLDSRQVQNYCVEIGGEVVTRGISPKRVPWKIGVTKPTDEPQEGGELQAILNITDRAMATSGNYRNFYVKDGKRYAHTIDPKTGRPVQHNILSATVLTDRCAVADAYATSFMVLGLERTRQLLDRHPELMVYLIYDDHGQNRVWYSPSLKDKIQE